MKPGTSTMWRMVTAVPAFATLTGMPLGSTQAQGVSSLSGISITVGPPPLPIYEQPICPGENYAWIPGYWAWGGEGYFWVPGTWVLTPAVDMLWTPGYWEWSGEGYEFRPGYWGPHVGFYGGINYGCGYGGSGFEGAHWRGVRYYYNRAVTHVDATRITHVYTKTVVVNNTHIAYNGGAGGIRAVPTPQEKTSGTERHLLATAEQSRHDQSASLHKELLASVNRGKPPVAATLKPADFSPKSVVPAKLPGGNVAEATLKATPRTALSRVRSQPDSAPASHVGNSLIDSLPKPTASANERPTGHTTPAQRQIAAKPSAPGSVRAPASATPETPVPNQARKANGALVDTPAKGPAQAQSPFPEPGRGSAPSAQVKVAPNALPKANEAPVRHAVPVSAPGLRSRWDRNRIKDQRPSTRRIRLVRTFRLPSSRRPPKEPKAT